MPTWAIKEVNMQKSHNITIVMEETADDGKKYLYTMTKGPNTTKDAVFADFRRQVLQARANRAKLEAIKAQINVDQIEAFLAQG